jgi:3D (Asp-Asp-Asp) domain-containing protein
MRRFLLHSIAVLICAAAATSCLMYRGGTVPEVIPMADYRSIESVPPPPDSVPRPDPVMISIGKKYDGIEVVAVSPNPTTVSTAVVSKEEDFYIVRCLVKAYCPCARCCDKMTGITSTRTNAWKPGVAADPRAVAYGTRVFIEGYGETVVDDTGATLRRTWGRTKKIGFEVRMTYHWQAREWGGKIIDVKIYKGKD